MRRGNDKLRSLIMISIAPAFALLTIGCEPDFRQLRHDGQKALANENYPIAVDQFERAYRIWPGDPANLYDLGLVHLRVARERASLGNVPAALRECDRADWYFTRALEAHPGMQAATIAKNEALERKGQYEAALSEAEWASTFVGPDVNEQLYFAKELEERGDYDGALLRYRQAVAINRKNPTAHAALGQFLYRRGNMTMASAHLRRAYELNPREPGVADTLGTMGQPLPRTTPELEP